MNRRKFLGNIRNGAAAILGVTIFGINFKAKDDRDCDFPTAEIWPDIPENELKRLESYAPGMETLVRNDEGQYITIEGMVQNLDTSAWDIGTSLYINENGDFTDKEPIFSSLDRIVIKSHRTHGSIFVTPMPWGMLRSPEIATEP